MYNQTTFKTFVGTGVSKLMGKIVLFIFDSYEDYHGINIDLAMLSLSPFFTPVINLKKN